jgi:signal transduction histidine kinase
VRLDEVVLSVVREAEPLDPAVAIHVERLDDATVSGDALALQQLLLNLLDNAMRVSPPGGRVVVARSEAASRATVTVSDEGPGIEPDRLERIFDRLYSRAGGAGAGLGLAIARAIASDHDGHLNARNRAGGGATFGLSLPSVSSGRKSVDEEAVASGGQVE